MSAAAAVLPPWPDAVRAIPNGFLRSALFGVTKDEQRSFIKAARIDAVDGIEIHYTGEELNQDDLNVYANVLQVARRETLGSQYRVKTSALLRACNLTDTGKNRKTLITRLERLRACAIRIKHERYTFIGGLVDEVYKDDETQELVIVLSPKMLSLFAADQFTYIDFEIRRALGGQALAQWLHGFYSSHAKPWPVKIETFLKLCGSKNTDVHSGAQKLRKALDAVASASAAHGVSFSYEIRDELVRVTKHASATQKRHLAKKTGEQVGLLGLRDLRKALDAF